MKYKRYPYNDVVEKKLEQLPAVDTDHLWSGMHAILDKKMPQEKERRRFIAWFFTAKGLLSLAIISLTVSGSFFILLKKQNSIIDINNSTQENKSFRSQAAVSLNTKNNVRVANEEVEQKQNQNRKETNGIATSSSITQNDFNSNYDFSERQKYTEVYADLNENTESLQYKNAITADKKAQSVSVGYFITSSDPINFDIDNSISPSFNLTQQLPATNSAARNKRNNEKGFYAGIVSGVDLSSIHFQSMKPGATKGLIIGYAFNKKWSIESGLLWDNKRFYDDGTYFNPPGYTPTPGVTITAVNGKSRLYEVPVNVKYTIIPGKHSLFATGGLSSYFMRSENFDYEYSQTNQPGGHNYISYKDATKDWFSVANISLGYSHKLGTIGTIRVEPYLKLPITNLGIGNMPIMSTGLNIGFTKQLTR